MPSALMRLDQREQLLDQQRGQAERRLVEDQQLRLGHQAAADREHLLLAAGQRSGALALPFGKPREDREHAVAVARRGAPTRGGRRRGRDFRRTVMLGKMRRPSGTWIRPRATIAAGRACSMVAPSKRMLPRQGRMTPEMVRLSVDLPAPFEPSTATISPRRR